MSARAPKLEVEGLQKRFGGLTAVRDVSFSIQAGEILGLIGPNGSGKSTVMKSILGVERPDAGSVKVDGREVAGWPPHRIARLGVGMVFQHSRPLYRQTVIENIILGLLPDRLLDVLPLAATEARARAIAERVGLAGVLNRRPSTLPFADLRKMEIAKAIARDPQVVLIDEPFAGLTARETASFAALIAEMRADGRAVLIVDHNVKSISALVDRIYAMHVGERIAEGTVEEVMANPTVRKVYLGGALETAARPETAFGDAKTPFLEIENLNVVYGKAQALEDVSLHVHQGEFVAIVGLNGAGKTTLFNAVSGLTPYAGDIRRQGQTLRGKTAATIARDGVVQSPEGRELFGAMTVSENLDMGGHRLPDDTTSRAPGMAVRPVPGPEGAADPDRGDPLRRRAADADHRPGADDEARPLDPRRADAGPRPGDHGADLEGARPAQAVDRDDGAARRAERHLRPAPRRPRLRARTRPDRLGGRPKPVRGGSGRAVFIGARLQSSAPSARKASVSCTLIGRSSNSPVGVGSRNHLR